MPTIRTEVDQTTYVELQRLRRDGGLPSVSALFLKKCKVLTDDHEAAEIVREALRIVNKKRSGHSFRLRDLFPSARWEQFSKGARLRAGRLFNDKVKQAILGIRENGKSASNHQLYVKA